MNVARLQTAGPYAWSLALHATILAALGLGATLSRQETVAPMPIEAMVVDAAVLEALASIQREEATRTRRAAERLQQQRLEEQARREQQRLESERLEAETRAQNEAQRLKDAETQARRKAQADAAARRAAEAAATARHKADADARTRESAERRRQAEEASARAQREYELRARLADEEQRTAAVASGLRSQYVALIQARVQRNWIRPATARPGLKCTVRVAQIPGGEVIAATLGACNGDETVRQSIISAVLRSSPLPAPPDPALFERNLLIEFVPED